MVRWSGPEIVHVVIVTKSPHPDPLRFDWAHRSPAYRARGRRGWFHDWIPM